MNTSWDAPDEEAIPPIPAAGNSNGDLPMLQFATQQVLRVLFRWLEEKRSSNPMVRMKRRSLRNDGTSWS